MEEVFQEKEGIVIRQTVFIVNKVGWQPLFTRKQYFISWGMFLEFAI
ncbi:hypothetical protein [Paraflavitalea speifideaquila]|nr:hypothetical protein [Paraflavitalea speifideiaquila]